jgi:hypothetical protein
MISEETSTGICVQGSTLCFISCTSNANCPPNYVCVHDTACGHPACVSVVGC